MHSGKASEPSEPGAPGLVHSTAVRPSVKEGKKNFRFLQLQALQCPQFFGCENMQLVQPDSFFFFLLLIFLSSFPLKKKKIWCLDLVLHYKQEYRELYLGGKILKVTLLSTFLKGEM